MLILKKNKIVDPMSYYLKHMLKHTIIAIAVHIIQWEWQIIIIYLQYILKDIINKTSTLHEYKNNGGMLICRFYFKGVVHIKTALWKESAIYFSCFALGTNKKNKFMFDLFIMNICLLPM